MAKLKPTRVEFRREGSEAERPGAGSRPSGFALAGLPSDLAPGLYRLDIRTDRSAEDLDLATLLMHFAQGGPEERVHLRLARRGPSLRGYFVVPKSVRSLRFLPFAEFEPEAGSATLRRVSTTAYRLRRLAASAGQGARSPAVLRRAFEDLWQAWREGGVPTLRRQLLRMASPANDLLGGGDGELEFASFWKRRARETAAILGETVHWVRPDGTQGERPTLSLVVPVYRTRLEWLAALLRSMRDQSDPGFEAVFVLDGPQEEQAALLERETAALTQARIIRLPENRGVSAATNAGLRAASGDHVCVVDHDDRLAPGFVEAFRRAAEARDPDILYADEAITDAAMERVLAVASRGAFDLRFYLSHPYIVHPVAVRRTLALDAGGFDETLTVSQDVDFLLRCILKAKRVVHLPLVLYAWRTHGESLGHTRSEEVADNTLRAVRRFLDATPGGRAFEVARSETFNVLAVRPPLSAEARVAVVIPTKNRHEILRVCLRSVEAHRTANRTPFTVFVVDHESDDPETVALLRREREAGRIEVLPHAGPWNYAQINNGAVRRIAERGGFTHLVFMNNDIEIGTPDWLDRMLAVCAWGDVGTVGCRLLYPDGRIQHAGVVVGLVGGAEHSHKFVPDRRADGAREPGYLCSLAATRDYGAVTAALMLVPAETFERVGGFDETLAVGFNDTDLCLRIGELGLASVYEGGVWATHFESASRGQSRADPHPGDTARFVARHAEEIRHGDRHWGQSMDWHETRPRIALMRQKAFALRETRIRLP